MTVVGLEGGYGDTKIHRRSSTFVAGYGGGRDDAAKARQRSQAKQRVEATTDATQRACEAIQHAN